jgi:hypothetical protein
MICRTCHRNLNDWTKFKKEFEAREYCPVCVMGWEQ